MNPTPTPTPKQLVKAWLKELGLPDHRLTAKTWASPFGGPSRVNVTVHDWEPNDKALDLEVRAKVHGFFVRFSGDAIVYCSDEGQDVVARKRAIRAAYLATLAKGTT